MATLNGPVRSQKQGSGIILNDDFLESLADIKSRDIQSYTHNVQAGRPDLFASMYENSIYRSGGSMGGDVSISGMENIPMDVAPLWNRDITMLQPLEKKAFARRLYRLDPVIRACVDINVDAPLSKIKLVPPAIAADPELAAYINSLFTAAIDRIKLFSFFHHLVHELTLVREVYGFVTWDEETKSWESITLIDDRMDPKPEYDEETGEKRVVITVPLDATDKFKELLDDLSDDDRKTFSEEHRLSLPTDPYGGSFAFHIERKPSPLYDDPVSPMDSAFRIGIIKSILINAYESKLRKSSEHVDIYTVDGDPRMVDDLDYKLWVQKTSPTGGYIVTDYAVTPADKREPAINTFRIGEDVEMLNEQLFMNFGLNKAIVTGETSYGGMERVPLEIINTRFFFVREILSTFWTESLAKPMALANGFFVKGTKIDPEYLKQRLLRAYRGEDMAGGVTVESAPNAAGEESESGGELTSSKPMVIQDEASNAIDALAAKFTRAAKALPYKGVSSDQHRRMSHFMRMHTQSKVRPGRHVGYGSYDPQAFVSASSTMKPDPSNEGSEINVADPSVLWYLPTLSFKRLALETSEEAFTQFFNLYEKGSLPLKHLLDLYNLDADGIEEELKADMFTVRDAKVGSLTEALYQAVATKMGENPSVIKMIVEKLNLTGADMRKVVADLEDQSQADEGGGGEEDLGLGGGEGEGGGGGEEGGGAEEAPAE